MNNSNPSEKSNSKSIGDGKASGNRSPVTIIGLGPMGKTMAGVFLDRGHEVTVWNRTASKVTFTLLQWRE